MGFIKSRGFGEISAKFSTFLKGETLNRQGLAVKSAATLSNKKFRISNLELVPQGRRSLENSGAAGEQEPEGKPSG
jgi:hypothetical protein